MSAILDSTFGDENGCELEFFQTQDSVLIAQVSEGIESGKISLSFAQVEALQGQLAEWLEANK